MTARYNFKDADGAIKLPIDGTFYTEEYSVEQECGVIVVALYDANGDIVTPTAGTCAVEVSPIDGQWFNGASSGDSTIDLTLAGESATYELPVFLGPQTQARITLDSVAGADHAIAYIWRF